MEISAGGPSAQSTIVAATHRRRAVLSGWHHGFVGSVQHARVCFVAAEIEEYASVQFVTSGPTIPKLVAASPAGATRQVDG